MATKDTLNLTPKEQATKIALLVKHALSGWKPEDGSDQIWAMIKALIDAAVGDGVLDIVADYYEMSWSSTKYGDPELRPGKLRTLNLESADKSLREDCRMAIVEDCKAIIRALLIAEFAHPLRPGSTMTLCHILGDVRSPIIRHFLLGVGLTRDTYGGVSRYSKSQKRRIGTPRDVF